MTFHTGFRRVGIEGERGMVSTITDPVGAGIMVSANPQLA